MAHSLKFLAAIRIVEGLKEDLKKAEISLSDQQKVLIEKINSLAIPPDLITHLKICSSSKPLSKAIAIREDEEYFIKEFPELADTIKEAMKQFHKTYGNDSSCEIDASAQTLHARYKIIERLILDEINNPGVSLNDYRTRLFWAIYNGFEDLANKIVENISEGKRFDLLIFILRNSPGIKNIDTYRAPIAKMLEKSADDKKYSLIKEQALKMLEESVSEKKREEFLNIKKERIIFLKKASKQLYKAVKSFDNSLF